MKKFLIYTSFIGILGFASISCSNDDNDEKSINYENLPTATKTFLDNNMTGFSVSDISRVELDQEDGQYEVYYKNGIEIDFYSNGVWKEINLNGNAIPLSVQMIVPEKSLIYLETNYPNQKIDDIEKQGVYSENQNFKIELISDISIYFDAKGNVIQDKNKPGSSTGSGNTGTENNNPNILHSEIVAFLNNYFPNQSYIFEYDNQKVEVTFNTDTYNEIELDFNKETGGFWSVDIESNVSSSINIVRNIIQGVTTSSEILNYIDSNDFGDTYIEEFSIASSYTLPEGGYVVKLEGKFIDYKLYFNKESKFIKKVID